MSAPAAAPVEDDPLAALDALRMSAPATMPVEDDPLAALDALRMSAPATTPVEDDPLAALDALKMAAAENVTEDDPLAALDDLFAAQPAEETDDLLSGLPGSAPQATPEDDPLAALFAIDTSPQDAAPEDDPFAALFAIDTSPQDAAPEDDPLAALDALLTPDDPASDPLAGLEALLAAPETVDDPLAALEDLLNGSDAEAGPADVLDAPAAQPAAVGAALSAFGTLNASAPAPGTLNRPVFRLAVLGDFSGRASRGVLETGAALAGRRAIRLDVDTVEDVIAGFATTLVLPIGQDGRGIAVPLDGLDSLHPDELVQNVELFAELKGLRQRLSSPSMAARAVAEMQGWAGAFTAPTLPTQARSGAQAIPADRRLSDFQSLIGDRAGRLSQPSPAGDLIGRIVGPYVVPGPNPEAKALRGAVDAAMSAAMRLVLHHPDFQATEAAWRTVDMLARRIEADETLEIVLFDVSAEEVAADLAVEDIGTTGLFGLLAGPLTEEGQSGFSAVCALHTFEETPPHAALLGRLGQIAAHIQAPVLTALSPAYLDTARKDRNALVARAWDGLRADPVAHWLGVASPRFLLRRPYGAFSEPIDAFDFEEFTLAEGLSGMLWGNPAALAAVLLARAWTDGGRAMSLGKQMSLGDMPWHIVTDPHGDQVQLPCTERNMTTAKVEATVTRGLMPVIGIKGRDVVRLGSFQSLAGHELAGRWSGNPPPARAAGGAATLTADIPADGSAEAELDALLAGFADAPAAVDPAAIDAELAALLEGL
jgi:hypothetical protein